MVSAADHPVTKRGTQGHMYSLESVLQWFRMLMCLAQANVSGADKS